MQDTKDPSWTDAASRDASEDSETPDDRQTGVHAGDSRDADGWQKYRKWISKSPAPSRRRSGLDPSLYTWKGYRSWTEHVKRNWSDT
jgi:hypothetical protein